MDSKVLKTESQTRLHVSIDFVTGSHFCLNGGARASQDSKSTVAVSDRENMAVPGSLLQSRPMRRQQGTAGETLNNTYFLQFSLNLFYS